MMEVKIKSENIVFGVLPKIAVVNIMDLKIAQR